LQAIRGCPKPIAITMPVFIMNFQLLGLIHNADTPMDSTIYEFLVYIPGISMVKLPALNYLPDVVSAQNSHYHESWL
jgi:hypothetical protein